MNKIVLIGRLTRDPELKFVGADKDKAMCQFGVAVTRQFKKDEADFINCKAFGKTGETIANYLTKGSQIALEGSIRTGSYDDKDGKKIYTTEVMIERFEFVGGNKDSKEQSEEEQFEDNITPVSDTDMPF